jgi:superfamily I DNA and/or RNA helicase
VCKQAKIWKKNTLLTNNTTNNSKPITTKTKNKTKGTSYLNRAEAANVERLLTRLLSAGVQPRQLGVITPYEGQRAHVAGVLARCGALRQELYRAVEVSSVDAFQVCGLSPFFVCNGRLGPAKGAAGAAPALFARAPL